MSTNADPDAILTPFCGDLRSKRYLMLDTIPTRAEQYLDPSMHCWCYHTQQVIGPDGGHVGPDDCVPGRSCYRSALAAEAPPPPPIQPTSPATLDDSSQAPDVT